MDAGQVRETIENWVGDFGQTDAVRRFKPELREHIDEILTVFLVGACEGRGAEPGDIEQGDIRGAIVGPVARLGVAEGLRGEVPELCGAFLTALEMQGRLAGGCGLGAYAHALREAYLEAASEATTGKRKPITNAGSKIGRNDPCPCGSGKKYKKCCMGS